MSHAHPSPVSNEVGIRDVEEADLPTLFEQQMDPEATRMAAFPARDREAFMAHWTRILADDSVGKRTILLGGRVAGNIVSWGPPDQRLVGYWIGREYWGRGIATRALAAYLAYEAIRPLHAHVAKHNLGSIRVLEKCGFKVSGEDVIVLEATGEEIEDFIMELPGDGEEAAR